MRHPARAFLALVLVLPVLAHAVERAPRGREAMVVSAHPEATRAGVQILRGGGNAVDAAVTVSLCLSVCEPYSSGLGGGAFALTFDAASGEVRALDARETAPASATRDMYLAGDGVDADRSRYGPLAVAVPSLTAGLRELHRVGGSLPWSELVEPARRLAAEGFPVSDMLCDRIEAKAERLDEAARAIFMPDGRTPAPGHILVQPDLARTLAAVAASGPAALAEGPVAEAIVEATGGVISRDDLAGYRPRWRDPVHGTYRGHDVWSMSPPSSGGVHLVEMLNILEGYDLGAMGYGSSEAWHVMAEAMKHAYADRSRWLGDPDHWPVPVARLTDRGYADSLRARIRRDGLLVEAGSGGRPEPPAEGEHTSHFSIVDGSGNAVALTQTINLSFGSGVVAAGTGIVLNDEMDDFAAAPGVPNAFGLVGGEANAVGAGKRPLSSMTPTIVLVGDRVRLVSGSPGGSRIINTTLQTIIHVLDFGMDARWAVTVPRIHHQWRPSVLFHEPWGMSPDTAAALEAVGHRLQERKGIGNAQLIVVDPETGMRHGAADPRGMGLAAGF